MAGEAKNGVLPYKGGTYYLWHYVPSMPGAIIFIILFILAAAAHSYRMFRFRQWFYIPFILGCIFEAIGYVGFAISHDKTDQLLPFIIQSVFILVAPALFAATVYMILGRLVARVPSGPSCSLIRPAWLTRTFVVGDVFSFLLQASGGGLMAVQGRQDLGQNILLVGLFVQIVMFGLFVVVAVAFHVRYARMLAVSGAYGGSGPSPDGGIPWLKVLYMLYSVSLLIMVRSIFRVIEYILGQDGYPLNNQWTLFIFDSLLMFLVTALFFFMFHPNDMVGSQQQDVGFDEVDTSTSVDMPLQQKTRAQV
ncbi:hypothetical protein KVR01_012584 [Diaporthe batatas]|uniref:uncharacterized protein n=1 Tax=Diaporthe batatas TaxID=748121 RepID=UPI001D0559B8|nr:uncharacterized protein KVR01_012584 [Diaporthe batatas]KAG8157542.1 hypothetical protein KVR01_012584 [Diaporthe batatas]